jgi:hypothetical protein
MRCFLSLESALEKAATQLYKDQILEAAWWEEELLLSKNT